MPCHTKFEQFLDPVSSLAKQRGSVHRQQACTGWHSKLCKPPVFASLWSRESEVNNVCWKCPHNLIQIHGRWTANAQEVWAAKGFRCCNENLSPTNCSDNQSPTGRRSSTIICRPPNSSENHPKRSGCRRSARGCRCNSLTTNRRLVGDHRQTFADLFVRGRRLAVAIVWLWLYGDLQQYSIYFVTIASVILFLSTKR